MTHVKSLRDIITPIGIGARNKSLSDDQTTDFLALIEMQNDARNLGADLVRSNR